jgi:hypothetical protein
LLATPPGGAAPMDPMVEVFVPERAEMATVSSLEDNAEGTGVAPPFLGWDSVYGAESLLD